VRSKGDSEGTAKKKRQKGFRIFSVFGDARWFLVSRFKSSLVSRKKTRAHPYPRPHPRISLERVTTSHRREVHTVAIVPPADDSPDAPAGVLTGSEDGFVLRAAARGDGAGAFFDPAEVGAHVGGAAVRAIALVPDVPGGGLDVPPASEPPGSSSSSDPPSSPLSYILLTAGAKEVLHAWRVSWERASAPAPASGSGSGVAWRLRTSLVATRGSLVKAGHAEWTKGCGFVAASVESDQRYMDVAGFVPVAGGGAVALAATSEGAVSAMALVPRRGTKTREGIPGGERMSSKSDRRTFSSSHSSVGWRAFADLKFHDRPVLAVDVAGVRVDGGGDKVAVVAATGATDGALAIWEISDALPKTESIESESSSSSVRTVRPCHVTRGAHQSGVNGVAVRAVGGDAVGVFVAASGGDDQVARCEVFVVKPSRKRTEATEETSSFCVVSVARVAVAFAHSSAIKGVWLGPGTLPGTLTLATTSHDQRARVWTASVEAKDDDEKCSATIFLTPVAGAFAECPEPEGLDGFVDARGRTRIAVCGRGVQMFELE
jgi:WD repeat-containing protein 6